LLEKKVLPSRFGAGESELNIKAFEKVKANRQARKDDSFLKDKSIMQKSTFTGSKF